MIAKILHKLADLLQVLPENDVSWSNGRGLLLAHSCIAAVLLFNCVTWQVYVCRVVCNCCLAIAVCEWLAKAAVCMLMLQCLVL